MSQTSPMDWLVAAVERATRSARFCTGGCLPAIDPGLEVSDVGPVPIPFKPKMLRPFLSRCKPASYGKGTQTFVDTKIRNTLELSPNQFRLSKQWNAMIPGVLDSVASELGLPANQLEASLYKLLVYEKGGFFLPHRDSEKLERMLGSLVIVLPNKFEGGALVVRHRTSEEKFIFAEAATAKSPCYAAFYADCEHEIERVTRGRRLALVYNLTLAPSEKEQVKGGKPSQAFADAVKARISMYPDQPLVFALEHEYTQRGLSLDLLKGTDRELASLVTSAAEQLNCEVHLTQVERHTEQFADDGRLTRGYRFRGQQHTSSTELVVGEIYEDTLNGTHWTDLQGNQQPWEQLPLELSSIVASVPIEDWQPTSEQFYGYTGNEGNTLDRWYRRTALVLWREDQHFQVVAKAGPWQSIPIFAAEMAKLATTLEDQRTKARSACISFANAIIADWPEYGYTASSAWTEDSDFAEESTAKPLDVFAKHLLLLQDRDTTARFLWKLAELDWSFSSESFILPACEQFGWGEFAEELKRLVGRKAEPRSRDIEWLWKACSERTPDPTKAEVLDELCEIVTDQICSRPITQPRYRYAKRSISNEVLVLLLKSLAMRGLDKALARVIGTLEKQSSEFPISTCQVAVLREVLPWSQQQFGCIYSGFETWLNSVRAHLESATATAPQPPTDWTRDANIRSRSEFDAEINAFLAHPGEQSHRIAANEDVRRCLIDAITSCRCDLDYSVEKVGRPYSLVLTKNTRSYDLARERFQTELELLSTLASY